MAVVAAAAGARFPDSGSSNDPTANSSGSSSHPLPPAKRRRYNTKWAEGHEWLEFCEEEGTIIIEAAGVGNS